MKLKEAIISILVCCITVQSKSQMFDWFEAQELCRNSNKRLTTYASNASEFIWTGRHKRFSQWIKILGCFKDTDVKGMFSFNMTELPSIGSCQEQCLRHHYSIYAVKDTECRCLQSDFTAIPLPSNKCNGGCSNKDDDILSTECGGEESFNVFSTDTGIEFMDVQKPCIALQCTQKDERFHMNDCADTLGIICSISEVHIHRNRWKDSFKSCKSNISKNPVGIFNFSNPEEACEFLNMTYDSPLWIAIVREEYVSEEQGEHISERRLFTKCQKCTKSYCKFVTCFDVNITDVQCQALTTENPDIEPQGESNLDIRLIIDPATAAFVVGTGIIIFLIFRRRERRQPKTSETPAIKTDYEIVQKRKTSNKNKHYTKDDIRHLGHSNPSYIETTEAVKEQENPNCTKIDGDYDELHQTKSRKIERSDIFHYSLHLPPKYDIPCQEEKKETIVESGYDVAFTNRISKIELSKCHQENV